MMKLFNDGWTFLRTELDRQPEGDFKPVDLPHDWLIYDSNNLYEDGCGWYKKSFSCSADSKAGERVWIRFDGVYMDSTVYVNGHQAGEWKYGYSAFSFDITEYLQEGINELLVQVRHQSPNSRWYSGAGIFRNVWMKAAPQVYLPFDGSYVSIKKGQNGFDMEIETEVEGPLTENMMCRYSLWYQNKKVLDIGEESRKQTEKGWLAETAATVSKPHLWDTEDPHNYRLEVELFDKITQTVLDTQSITVGFRTMEFNAQKGFSLNGRHMKLNGVCEHHDFGCLGAAFHKAAMVRKFRILKEMGVNALRTSHNMPASELMDLADEMGFLIIDEAFDMWELKKTDYDYARFFPDWAKRDVASWVRRDRNHPSLLMWSIGNEIYDTHASARGQEVTRFLQDYVRDHDPKGNAPVTIGSNYMPWENAGKCADLVDLAGYNYGEKYYDIHHKEHPERIIYGSETASMVQSRGVYRFPLSKSLLADEDEQCSALGNSATSWGAESIEKCITDDRDAKYSLGQFIWTGFDYIGEPTPYHTKNSYFGQLDTAGFPKDGYYIFQAEWTDAAKQPMVHLFPYWDFNRGQMIDLRACSNGSAVELFINEKSYGKQEIDHWNGKRLLGGWQVPYEPGTIRAVAYDEDGRIIAEDRRQSFGDSSKIILTPDKEVLRSDGEDLCFLTITAEDAEGNPVENAMDYIKVSVEGPGRLLGLDNGDSTDYDSYKTDVRKLFNGKLLAVIGVTDEPGQITVTASGKTLTAGTCILTVQEAPVREGISMTEDCSKKAGKKPADLPVPVRKVALETTEGQQLSPEKKEIIVSATVYPANASDYQLIWQAVNDVGIVVNFAAMEVLESNDGKHMAKVVASGDGEFYVRCMATDSNGKVRIISQLEFGATGLGLANLNPYGFVGAGLFSDTIGKIGNGNEKGIATANDGDSGVVYARLDFGEYGSDEITIPIFTLNSEAYPIALWRGKPGEADSECLANVTYQKPSIWNVYQPETWKLPYRLKGLQTIAIMLTRKVHIKGFSFRYYEKAYSPIDATECNSIYGDKFHIGKDTIEGIGNNVTITYENMDFGHTAAKEILLCGSTPLTVNTIHILFTKETGETIREIVDFQGGNEEQSFPLQGFSGKGKVDFVFLPGSNFDFKRFQFQK